MRKAPYTNEEFNAAHTKIEQAVKLLNEAGEVLKSNPRNPLAVKLHRLIERLSGFKMTVEDARWYHFEATDAERRRDDFLNRR